MLSANLPFRSVALDPACCEGCREEGPGLAETFMALNAVFSGSRRVFLAPERRWLGMREVGD